MRYEEPQRALFKPRKKEKHDCRIITPHQQSNSCDAPTSPLQNENLQPYPFNSASPSSPVLTSRAHLEQNPFPLPLAEPSTTTSQALTKPNSRPVCDSTLSTLNLRFFSPASIQTSPRWPPPNYHPNADNLVLVFLSPQPTAPYHNPHHITSQHITRHSTDPPLITHNTRIRHFLRPSISNQISRHHTKPTQPSILSALATPFHKYNPSIHAQRNPHLTLHITLSTTHTLLIPPHLIQLMAQVAIPFINAYPTYPPPPSTTQENRERK